MNFLRDLFGKKQTTVTPSSNKAPKAAEQPASPASLSGGKASPPIQQPVCNPAPNIGERVQSLIRILTAPSQDNNFFNDRFDQAHEELVHIGKPALEPLIAALKDKDAKVRWLAVSALTDIGDERAVESVSVAVIAALKDDDTDERLRAAVHLGENPDARAVEPLIAALKDKDANVRMEAVSALGDIGDERAVDPLIIVLRDARQHEETAMWSVAFNALTMIGSNSFISPTASLNNNRCSDHDFELLGRSERESTKMGGGDDWVHTWDELRKCKNCGYLEVIHNSDYFG